MGYPGYGHENGNYNNGELNGNDGFGFRPYYCSLYIDKVIGLRVHVMIYGTSRITGLI